MKLSLLPDAKNCLCYASPLSDFLYRRKHHEAVTGTSISPTSLLLSYCPQFFEADISQSFFSNNTSFHTSFKLKTNKTNQFTVGRAG